MHMTTSSTTDVNDDVILLTQMFDKYSHARTFATPKIVIDIYAGGLSLAKYYRGDFLQMRLAVSTTKEECGSAWVRALIKKGSFWVDAAWRLLACW